MSWKKKIIPGLLIGFILIQFIQPVHNTNEEILATDITTLYPMPGQAGAILKNACYDCHSNNTRYPWYASIQPGGWWMASHIKNGKADLNFSEFGSYSKRKQQNKFRSIAKSIDEGSMPIGAYTIIHTDAKLTTDQKALITDWANKNRDSLLKTN